MTPTPYRTPKRKIAAMIVAIAYILSPFDLIPEVFLPLGVVDDATAFAWLSWAVGQEISRHRRSRQGEEISKKGRSRRRLR